MSSDDDDERSSFPSQNHPNDRVNVVKLTLQVVEEIQNGAVQPDVAAITELVLKQTMSSETQSLNVAIAVLIISWLISIVDSYRLGRGQDKDAEATVNGSI